MAGLIPFNRKNNDVSSTDRSFNDFYNMIDDFFSDSFFTGRNLLRDTFKLDIEEKDNEYILEAELPGIKKEEIDLGVEEDNLCITINRGKELNDENKNYIHRERRTSSMSRRIRLLNAKLDEIKAKLQDGVLSITVPKNEKSTSSRKIDIE